MAHVLAQHESRNVMKSTAIQIRGVNAHLGSAHILRDINIDLKYGHWINIIGPNGAGKSTLLKVLAGLTHYSGEVRFSHLSESIPNPKVKARHLAWLGQSQMGADDLSVYDVAMLGRLPHQGWLSTPSTEDRAAVEQALRQTQAWEWRERSLRELSGGERQRALLARALAVKAEIYLMDEPLANLDPPHQVDWLEIVKSLISEQKTVISVLHEISMALLGDEMIVMNCGQIMHQGISSDKVTHRAIESVFENRIQIMRINEQWISLPRMISDKYSDK